MKITVTRPAAMGIVATAFVCFGMVLDHLLFPLMAALAKVL